MTTDQFFLTLPIPIVGLLLFLLLWVAMRAGVWTRRRRPQAKTDTNEEVGTQEGYVVSGALGLLALLLGFTFALAVDRFDHRRALVLEEANAIGTTYLRAQLLDEPSRSQLSALLRTYADNRLALANATDETTRNRLMADSDRQQAMLWGATVAAVRPIRHLEIAPTFVETMNATIDAGAARVAARRGHVPGRVLLLLVTYMTISSFILGYVIAGSQRQTATAFLLGLLSLAYSLILDIDRPVGGGVTVPQTPMEDLITMMRDSPPARFGSIESQPPP